MDFAGSVSGEDSRITLVVTGTERKVMDSKATADEVSRSPRCYRAFIRATVALLKQIRDNPTPAKIDNVLIDLQTLTLEQE